MPITYQGDRAVFDDHVAVDDAESLLQWTQQHAVPVADLSQCTHLHPANLQVLMAARVPVRAWPADACFAAWLATVLHGATTLEHSTTQEQAA
jgi:hypothetical protein